MKPLLALLTTVCLLSLLHTFPPTGVKSTVLYGWIDDRDRYWLNVELEGGGYASCKVSREIYERHRFHDLVRVYPISDDQATFVAFDGRGEDWRDER